MIESGHLNYFYVRICTTLLANVTFVVVRQARPILAVCAGLVADDVFVLQFCGHDARSSHEKRRRALFHGTTSELIKERLELVKEGSFRQARAISACACAGDSTLGEEKLSWDGLSGGGRKYP